MQQLKINKMKYFEVILNNNFAFPSYTLEVSSSKKAVKLAVNEAKANRNDNVTIVQVDSDGNMIKNGYNSGTIKIN